MAAHMEQDVVKLISSLKGLSDQVSGVTSSVQTLLKKVEDGEVSTSKGISFLEVKYHLLLSYLMNVTCVMMQKTEGRKLSGNPSIEHLVEIRTVLERMRPIDQKLHYQVDKLVKTAATGTIAENDPLRYKPNPGNLLSKLDEEDAEDSSDDDDEVAKPKKYVPPKVVAMHYDGDETVKQRQEKHLEKAKKRALSSALMQELRQEYFDGPEEVREGTHLHRLKDDNEARHKREYEEENFVRLQVTKKEKQAQRRLTTTSSLKSLTRFDDISILDQSHEDMPTKKKRKLPSKLRKKLQKSAAKKRKRNY